MCFCFILLGKTYARLTREIMKTGDFVDYFCGLLFTLNEHDFIAKKQSEYFEKRKEKLSDDEVIAIMDFSENIAFEIQDAAQSYFYGKEQCTIHPVCMYYKENGELKQKSIIIIYESKEHKTETVYMFQTHLVDYVKTTLKKKKIVFFSDGAPSHYKNKKNFLNLCLFKRDFDVDAEWHYFATSHGKSPCDVLGGSFKRNAHLHNMKHPTEPIDSSKELYEWAKKIQKSKVHFIHCDEVEYKTVEQNLATTRYNQNVRGIKGSQSFHGYKPFDEKNMMCWQYSQSAMSQKFKLIK